MKKLLLGTVATVGLAAAAISPAQAEGALDINVGGWFAGYAVYNDQDEPTGTSFRNFDFRKETEIHVNGETTLDNGLTVGVMIELNVDRDDDTSDTVEESYAYFQGGWGRINFGEEEGAPYLLQVAAPSADANIDGIQPEINSFDLGQLVGGNIGLTSDVLGYDQTPTGYANKFTYFTPVFNGFQAGVSYTPAVSEADQNQLAAITVDDNAGFDDAIELAARYEGSFEDIDVALGAGYSKIDREITAAGQDDRTVWNAGLDIDWMGFGLGVAYRADDNGIDNDGDTEVFVVGVDYHTGPYSFGLSYYDREDEAGSGTHGAASDVETTRWTGGAAYEYGPGMSFRGSIAFVESEDSTAGTEDRDGYQVTLGTQIDF